MGKKEIIKILHKNVDLRYETNHKIADEILQLQSQSDAVEMKKFIEYLEKETILDNAGWFYQKFKDDCQV